MSLIGQLIDNLIAAVRHIDGLTLYFRISGIHFGIPSLDLLFWCGKREPRSMKMNSCKTFTELPLFETKLKQSDRLSQTSEETIWNPSFVKNCYGFLGMDNCWWEGSGQFSDRDDCRGEGFEADVLTKGKVSFRKLRICPIVATGGWL
jgi:hypothetical protein